jgi:hypothetical protein
MSFAKHEGYNQEIQVLERFTISCATPLSSNPCMCLFIVGLSELYPSFSCPLKLGFAITVHA